MLLQLLAPLALALPTRPMDLIIVGPGTPFGTNLQAAVNQVAEGGTVLVQDGTYGDIDLPPKSLNLASAGGAAVSIDSLVLDGMPAGKRLTVRRIRTDFIILEDASGVVLLEEITLLEEQLASGHVFVRNCADVVLTRIAIEPTTNPSELFLPLPVIEVEDSRLALFDSVLGTLAYGSHAVLARGAELYIQNCRLTGADGRDARTFDSCFLAPCAFHATDGGAGLRLQDDRSDVVHWNTTFSGGRGGDSSFSCCFDGSDAPPIQNDGSAVSSVSVAAQPPELALSRQTLRVGQTFTTTGTAPAGAFAWLLIDLDYVPGLQLGPAIGRLYLSLTHGATCPLGVVPTAPLRLSLPALAGLPLSVHVQAIAVHAGEVVLGAPGLLSLRL